MFLTVPLACSSSVCQICGPGDHGQRAQVRFQSWMLQWSTTARNLISKTVKWVVKPSDAKGFLMNDSISGEVGRWIINVSVHVVSVTGLCHRSNLFSTCFLFFQKASMAPASELDEERVVRRLQRYYQGEHGGPNHGGHCHGGLDWEGCSKMQGRAWC
jgi:hypothetical protein